MSRAKFESFADEKYFSLETFKRDGTGVKTPIWFASGDGEFYVYTLADSWKVKRIRNNPRVRIAPCDMRGNVKGEWVEAEARFVVGEETQLAHRLLNKKYGLLKRVGNFFGKLKGSQYSVIAIRVA